MSVVSAIVVSQIHDTGPRSTVGIVSDCRYVSVCADTCTYLTADQGVMSLVPARSHTFVEIDHEIISAAIVLTSTD